MFWYAGSTNRQEKLAKALFLLELVVAGQYTSIAGPATAAANGHVIGAVLDKKGKPLCLT